MPVGNTLYYVNKDITTVEADTVPWAEILGCIKRENALNMSVHRFLHDCTPAAPSSCCHDEWPDTVSQDKPLFLELLLSG